MELSKKLSSESEFDFGSPAPWDCQAEGKTNRIALLYKVRKFTHPLVVVSLIWIFALPEDLPWEIAIGTFWLAMIHLTLVALFWRSPSRAIILRPFDFEPSARSISVIVRKYLRYYGHSYTLTDTYMVNQEFWGLLRRRRAFLVLRIIHWWLSFRKSVESREDLVRLAKACDRKWVRNLNLALSVDGIFKVSTSGYCWQDAVRILGKRSNVIILDVTRPGQGLGWEIEMIQNLGLIDRTIFIADAHNRSASSWLETRVDGSKVFFYDCEDRIVLPQKVVLLDEKGFVQTIRRLVSRSSN